MNRVSRWHDANFRQIAFEDGMLGKCEECDSILNAKLVYLVTYRTVIFVEQRISTDLR